MNSKYDKKSLTAQNIFVWTVGILLMLTMLSSWLISSLYAKYVVESPISDSARVAAGGNLELWEHEAYLDNGIYKLYDGDDGVKESKVQEYTYEKVIPGVDIPKDPFISLDLVKSEVAYELYVQVTESDYFPETVTYKLADGWEVFDEAKGIYKYNKIFDPLTLYEDDIPILENNKLYVSEHYVGKDEDGNDQKFSLTFNAWIKQAD